MMNPLKIMDPRKIMGRLFSLVCTIVSIVKPYMPSLSDIMSWMFTVLKGAVANEKLSLGVAAWLLGTLGPNASLSMQAVLKFPPVMAVLRFVAYPLWYVWNLRDNYLPQEVTNLAIVSLYVGYLTWWISLGHVAWCFWHASSIIKFDYAVVQTKTVDEIAARTRVYKEITWREYITIFFVCHGVPFTGVVGLFEHVNLEITVLLEWLLEPPSLDKRWVDCVHILCDACMVPLSFHLVQFCEHVWFVLLRTKLLRSLCNLGVSNRCVLCMAMSLTLGLFVACLQETDPTVWGVRVLRVIFAPVQTAMELLYGKSVQWALGGVFSETGRHGSWLGTVLRTPEDPCTDKDSLAAMQLLRIMPHFCDARKSAASAASVWFSWTGFSWFSWTGFSWFSRMGFFWSSSSNSSSAPPPLGDTLNETIPVDTLNHTIPVDTLNQTIPMSSSVSLSDPTVMMVLTVMTGLSTLQVMQWILLWEYMDPMMLPSFVSHATMQQIVAYTSGYMRVAYDVTARTALQVITVVGYNPEVMCYIASNIVSGLLGHFDE